MTEPCGIYGLPRKLINFLRQMEKYKESLKWNINEGSQKLCLTMTWSLNKDRNLSFVDRMKRTLRLNSTWSEEGIQVPKRSGSFSRKGQRSPERRCSVCNSSIPRNKNSESWSVSRNSSLNRSSRDVGSCSPIRDANFNRSYSVRDSSINRSSLSVPRSPTRTSTPKKESFSIPELSELHDCSNSSSARSARLSYRTVEDLEISYKDLFQKAKAETTRQLDSIKKEWNKNIRRSTRRRYSSSSSTSSIDDVINSNGDPPDVTNHNEGIPSNCAPNSNVAPVNGSQVVLNSALEGTSQNHGNILHNDLVMVQRTSIVKTATGRVPRKLSYSTDIL